MKNLKVIYTLFYILLLCSQLWAADTILSVQPGDRIPDFKISMIDGKKLVLSELKGKVAILAFWKCGYGYSEKTLIDLQRIYDEFKDRGLKIFAVNADKATDAEIKEIMASLGLKYSLASDPDLLIYSKFGTMVLPTTLVVGLEGQLVFYRSIYPRDYFDQVRGYVLYLFGDINRNQLREQLQAIKLDQDAPSRKKACRYVNLGKVLLNMQLKENALDVLNKAIKAYPEFLAAHMLLAEIYIEKKNFKLAIDHLDHAKRLDPSSPKVNDLRNKTLLVLEE